MQKGIRTQRRRSRTIKPYAAFKVHPIEIGDSGLSNTTLLPAIHEAARKRFTVTQVNISEGGMAITDSRPGNRNHCSE